MSDTDFGDLRELYQQVILDRGRKPRYISRPERVDASAKGDNPMCGDRLELWLQFNGDTIAEVGFKARGCAISVASADLMAEAIRGRTPATAKRLCEAFSHMVQNGTCAECEPELAKPLSALQPLRGVHEYPSRIKCANLPWRALTAALTGKGEANNV
jgi:nitrogen fixation protein NifU and related proteins